DVLRAHAPMWLLQMPSLMSAADRELLSREVYGATRERMLREMGEALEALTSDQPLVIILEDLHWSDYSTLDLISYLASQRRAGQLMLIGTYRTVELIVSGHPLKAVKQELLAKQQCEELPLEYLSEDAVAEYLSVKFPTNRFPSELGRLIHERTEGNPLFMVNVVNYLLGEGKIIETGDHWRLNAGLEELEVGVPENIREMIEKQIARLTVEDQQVLEAASISGMNCSALAIASALGEDVVEVEARCEELARRNCFLRVRGVAEFPDGTVSARYGFIHSLYVSTLYERIPAARRARLHKDMAERGEIIYGSRAGEIATELAAHFEQGRDYKRAAKYLQKAADNAIRRFAYKGAVALSRRGLELLGRLPDTPERAAQELCLQLTLGIPLIATKGYAAADVGSVYMRARELCRQLGETPEISEVLWGLRAFYALRSDLGPAREIAEEVLSLAERQSDPGLAMRGHWMMLSTFMHLGEFAPAIEHFEKALLLYDPGRHRDDAFLYALNPGVAMPCLAAWVLWFLGLPDQSLQRIQEGLTLARDLSEPNGLAYAFCFAAILYQLRREEQMTQEHAEAGIAVSREHGLVMFQALATVTRGWSLFEQRRDEAIEQMREGLEALQATGTEFVRPHFLALLAEALGKARQHEEGLGILEDALSLTRRNGEQYYQAELYRLKGELLLMQSKCRGVSRMATGGRVVVDTNPPVVAQAEGCFNESIKIARQQQAKSWELRAATSLARLYQNQNKREEGRALLTKIYDRFTEGFATVDLREAKALLDELS
ncbi:MAG TPA: AAA family ATPase, partial [Pyrinomonadaceae bacterium]|nr:AAA family ATPase [Pyrinomonadaceae bacterium]